MNEGKNVDASSVFETPPVRRHESIEMGLAKFVHAGSSFVSEMVEPDHRGRIVEGIVTLVSHVHRIPVFGAAVRLAEGVLADVPVARNLGGFLLSVLRKQ